MNEENTKGKRGGSRPGAGRKGRASGSSRVIRVPESISGHVRNICEIYDDFVDDPKKKASCRKQMMSVIDEILSVQKIKPVEEDPRQMSFDW